MLELYVILSVVHVASLARSGLNNMADILGIALLNAFSPATILVFWITWHSDDFLDSQDKIEWNLNQNTHRIKENASENVPHWQAF